MGMFSYLKPSGRQMMSTNENDELSTGSETVDRAINGANPAIDAGVEAVFGQKDPGTADGETIGDGGNGALSLTPGNGEEESLLSTPGNGGDDFTVNASNIEGDDDGTPADGDGEVTYTMDDFYNVLENANKYADDEVEKYKAANPRPLADGEVDYSGMSPEEIEKIQKREKRKRTWMGIVDALKDAANAFGVTQGVGASNWGQTYAASEDARKARIQNEILANKQKYKAEVDKKRDQLVKDYLAAYRDNEKKVVAKEKERKAEAEKAEKKEEDKKRASRREMLSRLNGKSSFSKEFIESKGFSEDEAQALYDANEAEVAKYEQRNKDAHTRAISRGKSKSEQETITMTIDGKKYTYKGKNAIDDAYDKIMDSQGKKVKHKDSDEKRSIVKRWLEQNGGTIAANDDQPSSGNSMRDKYLAKRGKTDGDGSSPDDWA